MHERDKAILLRRQKSGETPMTTFEAAQLKGQVRDFRDLVFRRLKKYPEPIEESVLHFQKILRRENKHVSAAGATSYYLSEVIGRSLMYRELDKRRGNSYKYWADASMGFITVTSSVAAAERELFYGTPDETIVEIAQDVPEELGTPLEIFLDVKNQFHQLAEIYKGDESRTGIDVVRNRFDQIVDPNSHLLFGVPDIIRPALIQGAEFGLEAYPVFHTFISNTLKQ